MPAKGTTLMT